MPKNIRLNILKFTTGFTRNFCKISKNRKFVQKSKICSKIENLLKNQNFGQNLSYIFKILVKTLVQSLNIIEIFYQSQKALIKNFKIEILKNFHFYTKKTFWSKC